jgi:hypothetical protein
MNKFLQNSKALTTLFVVVSLFVCSSAFASEIGGVSVSSPVTIEYGVAANVNYTISYTKTGNGGPNSYSLSITGLPTGVTASFTPAIGTTGNGNNATYNSTIVTLIIGATVPAGTYNFTATANGINATGTLIINKAPLTITANNGSKTYGQNFTVGSGSTAFTSSGLKNSDTITSITIASTGAVNTAGVGSYSIIPSAPTGSFNPNNYLITFNSGTLTVTAASLTITASSTTKCYGATYSSNSNFIVSGLVLGQIVGSVTLTSAGSASGAEPGIYSIVPSAATGGTFTPSNYNIVYSNGVLTVSSVATWTGVVNTDWFTASNWDCGVVPAVFSDVVISNVSAFYPEISSDITINSLTLNTATTLKVNPTYDLKVTNAIAIDNNATLILENSANLIQINDLANTGLGKAIVKRNSSAIKRLDYTLWSSPVAGQGVYAFSPTTLPNRFYRYNTTTDGYNSINFNLSNLQYPAPLVAPLGINGTDDNSITFDTAKGYLIRVPWNHPTAPAVFAGQFKGIPNNGNITYSMDLSGEGYNLVGNPYPSKLSVVDFIDGNPNIEGTLYFWRKTNDVNATTYATLTKLAYTANTAAGGDTGTGFFNSGDQANWVVNVGQGFFVQADSANNQLYFNNEMRRGSNNQDQFFRTNGENASNNDFVVEGVYWLNLSNETSSISQIAVGYSPNSTLGVDRGIDGKNINKDMYLASQIDGNDFAIQGRSSFVDTDVVPLSFKITTSGNYAISIGQLSGLFSDSQIIYLKDKVLNVTYSLTENGAYNFNSAAGTFTDRFEVVYTTAALGIDNPTFTANHVIVYKGDSNQFIVNSGNVEMSSIKVFDIRGRLLTSQNNINTTQTNVPVEAATQVLLMQITSTDGTIVTKKVIR